MEALIDRKAAAELSRHVAAIEKHVPLRPIRSGGDYEAAVQALNGLLDAGAANESHPLANLAATLGELIADYDESHHAVAAASPAEILLHLMEAHGLRQGDLPEVGSQGVVSEILHGRRELNLRQVRALSQRFGLAPAVFMSRGQADVRR